MGGDAQQSPSTAGKRIEVIPFVLNRRLRLYNQIAKADLIVADTTGRNVNVLYEIGYAPGCERQPGPPTWQHLGGVRRHTVDLVSRVQKPDGDAGVVVDRENGSGIVVLAVARGVCLENEIPLRKARGDPAPVPSG